MPKQQPKRRRPAPAPKRVVKSPVDRQAEILDAARALFLAHGYEATSVQQIIDRLGISKGAFYHHFASKEALLDRLVTRMAEDGATRARAAAEQAGDALDRLNAWFQHGWLYKQKHLGVGMEVMRVMYAADNLHLRMRLVRASHAAVLPVMAGLIGEGLDEGVFDCSDADWTAALILQIGTLVNDFLAETLFAGAGPDEERAVHIERRLGLYGDAVERLLGAPRGRIRILEPDAIPLIVAAARTRRGRRSSRASGKRGTS